MASDLEEGQILCSDSESAMPWSSEQRQASSNDPPHWYVLPPNGRRRPFSPRSPSPLWHTSLPSDRQLRFAHSNKNDWTLSIDGSSGFSPRPQHLECSTLPLHAMNMLTFQNPREQRRGSNSTSSSRWDGDQASHPSSLAFKSTRSTSTSTPPSSAQGLCRDTARPSPAIYKNRDRSTTLRHLLSEARMLLTELEGLGVTVRDLVTHGIEENLMEPMNSPSLRPVLGDKGLDTSSKFHLDQCFSDRAASSGRPPGHTKRRAALQDDSKLVCTKRSRLGSWAIDEDSDKQAARHQSLAQRSQYSTLSPRYNVSTSDEDQWNEPPEGSRKVPFSRGRKDRISSQSMTPNQDSYKLQHGSSSTSARSEHIDSRYDDFASATRSIRAEQDLRPRQSDHKHRTTSVGVSVRAQPRLPPETPRKEERRQVANSSSRQIRHRSRHGGSKAQSSRSPRSRSPAPRLPTSSRQRSSTSKIHLSSSRRPPSPSYTHEDQHEPSSSRRHRERDRDCRERTRRSRRVISIAADVASRLVEDEPDEITQAVPCGKQPQIDAPLRKEGTAWSAFTPTPKHSIETSDGGINALSQYPLPDRVNHTPKIEVLRNAALATLKKTPSRKRDSAQANLWGHSDGDLGGDAPIHDRSPAQSPFAFSVCTGDSLIGGEKKSGGPLMPSPGSLPFVAFQPYWPLPTFNQLLSPSGFSRPSPTSMTQSSFFAPQCAGQDRASGVQISSEKQQTHSSPPAQITTIPVLNTPYLRSYQPCPSFTGLYPSLSSAKEAGCLSRGRRFSVPKIRVSAADFMDIDAGTGRSVELALREPTPSQHMCIIVDVDEDVYCDLSNGQGRESGTSTWPCQRPSQADLVSQFGREQIAGSSSCQIVDITSCEGKDVCAFRTVDAEELRRRHEEVTQELQNAKLHVDAKAKATTVTAAHLRVDRYRY